MALLLRRIYQGYKYVNEEISDPRTSSWPLLASPIPCIIILGIYLWFVLRKGPELMKDRKPFNLEKIIIVYNALQIVACIYILFQGIYYAWGWKYKWICEPVDFSNTESAIREASLCYDYFLLKVIDLLDTVFFVLRKKNSHISFLHVYHHTGMVMITWGACKYLPGGHGTLVGVINCFVHIVMYSYYLLTVANPAVKQSLWWKKYITQLQIVQFLWLVLHFLAVLVTPNCGYPKWTVGVFLPQNLFMLILFLDFYRKEYILKPREKAKTAKSNGHVNEKYDLKTNVDANGNLRKRFNSENNQTSTS